MLRSYGQKTPKPNRKLVRTAHKSTLTTVRKSSQVKSMMSTDAGSDEPLCPHLS